VKASAIRAAISGIQGIWVQIFWNEGIQSPELHDRKEIGAIPRIFPPVRRHSSPSYGAHVAYCNGRVRFTHHLQPNQFIGGCAEMQHRPHGTPFMAFIGEAIQLWPIEMVHGMHPTRL